MAKRFSKIAILLMLVLALFIPMMVMSVGADAGEWTLVTDASTLKVGDQIVIVAASDDVAMSTTQNNNNRGQASVTKNNDNTVSIGDDVQIITLEAGKKADTFAFNVGTAGYLYAASSSSNHLKSQTTNNDNGSWTIEIDDGIATVKAQGTNTKNWLRHNSGNSIFSCYGGGQNDIKIYKFVETDIPAEEFDVTFIGPEDYEKVIPGNKITLPDAPVLTDSYSQTYVFAGWATNTIENVTDIKPELYQAGDTFIPYEDTTLHAVYYYTVTSDEKIDIWNLVTDSSTLEVGDILIIASYTKEKAAGSITNDYLSAVNVTFSTDGASLTSTGSALQFTLGGEKGKWTLSNNEKLLGATAQKKIALGSGTTTWDISFENTGAKIQNSESSFGAFRYNVSSPRFTTYTSNPSSTMLLPQLYRLESISPSVTYYTTSPVVDDSECEHTNTTTTTVDPTCTAPGSKTTTCNDCGDVSTETIPATGHQNTTTTTVAATCTKTGTETVTCDDCGATVSTTTLDKIAHNYENNVCTMCENKVINYSGRYYIASLRITNDVPDGNYRFMTYNLGTASTKRYQAEESDYEDVLPPHIIETTHVFVLDMNSDGTYFIYAEGIDENNYLGYVNNGGKFVAQEESVKLNVVPSTEEGLFNIFFNNGSEDRYLSLNNTKENNYFGWYKIGQEHNLALIPVSDHVWGEGEITKDATCTETGVMTYTCACGATKTEEIAATGHHYESVVTAPTCTEAGYTTYTCACGDTYTEAGNAALGHNEKTTTVDATCTENGSITVTCETCGETISTEIIEAKGHDHEAVVTAPTCTEAGYTTYTCDCGDSYTEVIPATGHNVVDGKCTVCEKDSVITGAALQIGENLAVVYQTVLAGNVADYTMVFTINGGEPVTVVGENGADGYVYFYFDQIAPQLMGANITAQLYCGEVTVDVKANYSVRAYCDYYLTGEGAASCSDELRQLLVDLLAYGAAAQVYTNTDVENLVNEGITGTAGNAVPTESVKNNEFVADANVIDSVGIRFSHDNKIYFILNDNATGTVTATVEIGGVVTNAKVEGNTIYTTGINATKLGEKVTVQISIDGVLVQTVTYSVNSYVYAVKDKTDSNANLAKALYNYGESAKDYVDSLK